MTMTQHRLHWIDAFNEPTTQKLRKPLEQEDAKNFDAARNKLAGIDGLTERMAWFGHGWHWTVGFFSGNGDEPVAIIIPNPEDLQIAMPLDAEFVNGLESGKIKKTVRDGLELARKPFETRWGIWSIDHPSLIDDLLELLKSRLESKS